jgi:O-acetyl-ADP-ribose deacetylase (regulator of RNase III)
MQRTWTEIGGNLVKMAKKGQFDVIAHGCNCKKNMGAGIAKEIKASFPMAYEADKNATPKMGDFSYTAHYKECIIVNAYTQFNPGSDGHGKDSDYNRYEAIRNSMKKINAMFSGYHIGLPLIGCGLAGLKWNKVKKILEEELKDMNVTIVHFVK